MSEMLLVIIIVNIFSFFLFGNDKRKAKKREWRTKERTFFILAFLGGAIGIWLGMKWFRHKTLHSSFKFGIPGLVVWNLVLFYLLLS